MAIGSEILQGKVQEANFSPLNKALASFGHCIDEMRYLGDEIGPLEKTIKELVDEGKSLFLSGGLGVTPDDLTKKAISKALGVPIAYSKEAQKMALLHYARRKGEDGKEVIGPEHPYARLPKETFPIENPVGLAPGIGHMKEGSFLFSLPGVPREFQAMLPGLFKLLEGELGVLQESLVFRTRFTPEEKLFGQLDPSLWSKLSKIGSVCSLPWSLGVDLYVNLKSEMAKELEEKKRQVEQEVHGSPIATCLWSKSPKLLEEQVIEKLSEGNLTLALAESCTGGLLSSKLTDCPGASKVLLGSFISYSEQMKIEQLKVDKAIIEKQSAVSEDVALQMARGARALLRSDIALAITGYAGPSGGEGPLKGVGNVAMALVGEWGEEKTSFHFKGDRKRLKEVFAKRALFLLWDYLLRQQRAS